MDTVALRGAKQLLVPFGVTRFVQLSRLMVDGDR